MLAAFIFVDADQDHVATPAGRDLARRGSIGPEWSE